MDGIPVENHQVLPMDEIAPGIRGLRIAFVNVFAITHRDGSWTLIDAALPMSASSIRSWAKEHHPTPPNAIVLTHGHFDHVSAAQELADDWNIPIYAHPLEFPYLTGRQSYPPPNVGAGGGLMSLLSPLYPRKPINVGDRLLALPDGASTSTSLHQADVPQLPDWKILHTPGHTPGHVSFFRKSDGLLLVGDAFCTTKPESFFEAALAQKPEIHGPPAYFTSDWAAARHSVDLLAQLNPTVVAPGHGKPLAGPDVAYALRKLAQDFPSAAVPENKQSQV